MKLRIVLQEKSFVVVHKPSGLVTYADSPEQKPFSAKDILEKQLKKSVYPIHRIDKDTCGLLVFCFNQGMSKELGALFRGRVVKKQYLAIVHGEIAEKGVVDAPLEGNKEKVKEQAATNFTRLAMREVELEGEKRIYSFVRCEPLTGRYHQVRRHMRMNGNPIIGDPEYGNAWDNKVFAEKFKVERTLLCAAGLAFPNRDKQEMVRLSTQPDEDFQRVMREFGWELKGAVRR